MTTRTLHLARALSLPLETVTQKLSFLGVTGSGKTYGASKLAELFFHVGAQFVVLDPVGVWYGLRLAKDGKKPSAIDIPIFGGLHGDVPLEATAGELLANLVVDKTLSAVIDVSQFESDAQKARFAATFAERFFFRKKAAPSAVHLFIEECQEFVPQNPQRGEEQMLHAFIRMQKLGRNFGIGSSYISQRPQEVNKKALNMAQTLFVFRTTGTHERKAIEQWIADKSLDQDIAGDLPKIATGHCHVWSPEFLKISETVHILEKETFNASATPDVGVAAKARELAPIDLERVRADMAATIEKAKADDPRELRKQNARLQQELKQAQQVTPKTPASIKTVNKPVLTDADRALLEKFTTALTQSVEHIKRVTQKELESLRADVERAMAFYLLNHEDAATKATGEIERRLDAKGFQKILDKLSTISPQPSAIAGRRGELTPRAPTALTPGRRAELGSRVRHSSSPQADGLTGAEQRILDAVAWWRGADIDAPSRHQAAFVAGYTVNGHFNNLVGGLRTKGLIDYPTGGGVRLTDEGVKLANVTHDALVTRAELVEKVLAVLEASPGKIFKAVVDAGQDLTREELAQLTGYTVNGHFNNMVGSLRSLGVIDYPGRGGVSLGAMFEDLH